MVSASMPVSFQPMRHLSADRLSHPADTAGLLKTYTVVSEEVFVVQVFTVSVCASASCSGTSVCGLTAMSSHARAPDTHGWM